MWNLAKSELIRFWRPALAFGLLHFALLRWLSISNLFEASLAKVGISLLIYVLAGLILGLYQLGSVKRLNQWSYLIHRPLPPGRILAGMAFGALLLLTAAIALPLLAMTLFLDLASAEWVDLRQYLLTPYVLGAAFSFYLAGCFIVLSPRRAAWLILVMPIFFLSWSANGVWIFVPMIIVLGWLGFLVHRAFKADLTTPLRQPLAVAALAAPAQYALFGLLVIVSGVVVQTGVTIQAVGWKSFAVFDWASYLGEETLYHARYRPGNDVLRFGLQEAGAEDRDLFAKQVELADVTEVRPEFPRFPVRHQPMFMDRRQVLNDAENEVRWVFSHDRMMFHGRSMTSGLAVGWLGRDGRMTTDNSPDASSRFDDVPFVIGDRIVLTPQRIYQFDPLRETFDLRFEVTGDERLISSLHPADPLPNALSNEALYLFDPRDVRGGVEPLEPRWTIRHPAPIDNLIRIDIAELIDSHLISHVYGRRSERGFADERQSVSEVALAAQLDGFVPSDNRSPVELRAVAGRTIEHDFPAWYRHRGFIISPVLQTAYDVIWAGIEPFRWEAVTLADVLENPPPARIGLWALVLASISAALAAWRVRYRDLTRAGRWAWIVISFVVGFPALLSLSLLTAKRESSQPAPAFRRRPSRPGSLATGSTLGGGA